MNANRTEKRFIARLLVKDLRAVNQTQQLEPGAGKSLLLHERFRVRRLTHAIERGHVLEPPGPVQMRFSTGTPCVSQKKTGQLAMVKGKPGGLNRRLESGRRARRDGARKSGRNCKRKRRNFKPVRRWNDGHGRRLRSNCRARSRANRAEVRSRRRRGQVRAEMELRPQEDNSEKQRHNADTSSFATHLLIKTKLRTDWLQGQVRRCPPVLD